MLCSHLGGQVARTARVPCEVPTRGPRKSKCGLYWRELSRWQEGGGTALPLSSYSEYLDETAEGCGGRGSMLSGLCGVAPGDGGSGGWFEGERLVGDGTDGEGGGPACGGGGPADGEGGSCRGGKQLSGREAASEGGASWPGEGRRWFGGTQLEVGTGWQLEGRDISSAVSRGCWWGTVWLAAGRSNWRGCLVVRGGRAKAQICGWAPPSQ